MMMGTSCDGIKTDVGIGASAASGSGSGASPQSTGAADMNSARIVGAGFAGLLAVFAL